MATFERADDGVLLILEREEAAVLKRLTIELVALFEHERDDPVLERLLPDAYEDEDDQRAYRELVGDSLEREKIEALEAVGAAAATRVAIAGDDVSKWLASLTDLRLALGTRLGVDEDRMSAGLDPSDPDGPALSVLHWLGWLQEGIIRTLEG